LSTTPAKPGAATIVATSLLAAGLVLLGFAAYEWHAARSVRSELLAREHGYIADLRRLHVLESNTRILDQRALASRHDSDPSAAGFEAGGKGSSAAGGAADPRAAGQLFLSEFPRAKALIAEFGLANLDMRYGPFYRAAGLTPDQIQRLENAFVDTWTQSLQVFPDGGIRPAVTQVPDDQLRAILGDQGFQGFEAYTQNMPAQNVVLQIAAAAGLSGSPMSPDQASQLVQAIAAIADRDQDGKLSLNTVDWDAAIRQAQAVLSPEQVQAAEPVFAQMQYQQALNRARFGTVGSPRQEPGR
jgi:hypothetical protein